MSSLKARLLHAWVQNRTKYRLIERVREYSGSERFELVIETEKTDALGGSCWVLAYEWETKRMERSMELLVSVIDDLRRQLEIATRKSPNLTELIRGDVVPGIYPEGSR